MAGTRRRKDKNGKPRPFYEGWFIDWQGKQRFFKGTSNQKETLRIAKEEENHHRKIRLGYLPPPKSSNITRSFRKVADEYLAWGNLQGGRGGRPWGKTHARMRGFYLTFWENVLGLKNLQNLIGILPKVEKILRGLKSENKSGKTLQNYADGLSAFCDWCKDRGYLDYHPLEKLESFDTTPTSKRRAFTIGEVKQLLQLCSPQRRLLYETAVCTGLRAGELGALRKSHLDTKRQGLQLEASWTKNRKDGFQQLPIWLVDKLSESSKNKAADAPLLEVPSHPARDLDKDLKAAGILKVTSEGKLDFHAFRVAYVSFVFEAGASMKEAQTLARHSNADLTINVYARSRENRLIEVTEKVGKNIFQDEIYDHSMTHPALMAGEQNGKFSSNKTLNSEMEWSGRRDSNP